MRMIEPRGELNLPPEASDVHPRRDVRGQNLNHYLSLELASVATNTRDIPAPLSSLSMRYADPTVSWRRCCRSDVRLELTLERENWL